MSLNEVRILQIPKILDPRGNLSFFENDTQVPFSIARTYWIYDVPGGEIRGGHAYRSLQEVIISLSGSFDVVLNDGVNSKVYSLNRSYVGLYVPSMVWRHMENFSTNSLALVVADKAYDEKEYMRDFDEFVSAKRKS